MLKIMLKPFFKRYIGLFISMVFVSLLSIGLLCAFGSTIINLSSTYKSYLRDYGNVDTQITVKGVTTRSNLLNASKVEGVDAVDTRLTLDCYLKKSNERTIVSRVFSFNEKTNTVFKRYVLDSIEKSTEHMNISICRKFAKNNDFTLGSTIQLGFFNFYLDFYVAEIIETPEGIYPRANDYIWSDNQDFGYVYVNEDDLNNAITSLGKQIVNEINTNETYKKYYESIISIPGITFPDVRYIDFNKNYVQEFANQLITKNLDGAEDQKVCDAIVANLKAKSVEVKNSTIGQNLPYRIYMENAIKQLRVATVFLPVFFYSVTMVVIGLFMNQIIKQMTSQIGIFMSIGIGKKDIVVLFLIFGLVMALTAGLLGVPLGYGLNSLMAGIMITTYSIPIIPSYINVPTAAIAIGALVLFTEIATFISCLAIFRITPKDAVISNEAKRKPLPKWLNTFINKAPMNIKLGTNAIAQNPRRFFVSCFSIFASLVLILLSSFFYVSKNEMIDQSTKRRLNYDCQVYLTQKEDQAFISDFKIQSFVQKDENNEPMFEDCYYTYVKATADGENEIYLECLAVRSGTSPLINIPNKNGRGHLSVPENGVILTKTDAQRLHAKKGDNIKINNIDVKVTDISYQYFHPITYLSKPQMESITSDYVSTFLVNITDETAFLNYLSDNRNECLTVFTKSLAKDLRAIFDAINIFIYIMIGFSLGMGFVILWIMSQNALMEQQRQLSVMRAVGFTVLDISNVWTLQSIAQLIASVLFAVPSGAGVAILLFTMCSSASQVYPFVMSWAVVGISIAFVATVIIACHLLSMGHIKSWNLADNTRSRE